MDFAKARHATGTVILSLATAFAALSAGASIVNSVQIRNNSKNDQQVRTQITTAAQNGDIATAAATAGRWALDRSAVITADNAFVTNGLLAVFGLATLRSRHRSYKDAQRVRTLEAGLSKLLKTRRETHSNE